jgi:hypothetical protein
MKSNNAKINYNAGEKDIKHLTIFFRHLSMAAQCVGFQVEHCSGQTQAHIYGILSYLQSIAGNRCPLLTAFMQCSEAVPATTTTTCSLKGVKQCVANITSCR